MSTAGPGHHEHPAQLMDALLGFAAGVILAVTSFSLIVPAIELDSI